MVGMRGFEPPALPPEGSALLSYTPDFVLNPFNSREFGGAVGVVTANTPLAP